MTVKFKFDYVLNLHDKNIYINAIERDGIDENTAYKHSLVQINRSDIKSITKMSNGLAFINKKTTSASFTTLEKYDEVIDTIKRANLALNIMNKEKVYIFDDFEVNSDELNVVEGWEELKSMYKEEQNKLNLNKTNGNKRK